MPTARALRAHYEELAEAAKAYQIIPVTLVYEGGEDISDMEATDVVILGDTLEQIDIGGGGLLHRTYLRVSSPDLVASLDALRRLCADAIDAVLDARQERADSLQRPCPGCGDPINPDEPDCARHACRLVAF